MKACHPPSGLGHGLQVLIDPQWTPEQVCAVFELLDDLRECIWAHYQLVLSKHYASERTTQIELPLGEPLPGEPF